MAAKHKYRSEKRPSTPLPPPLGSIPLNPVFYQTLILYDECSPIILYEWSPINFFCSTLRKWLFRGLVWGTLQIPSLRNSSKVLSSIFVKCTLYHFSNYPKNLSSWAVTMFWSDSQCFPKSDLNCFWHICWCDFAREQANSEYLTTIAGSVLIPAASLNVSNA